MTTPVAGEEVVNAEMTTMDIDERTKMAFGDLETVEDPWVVAAILEHHCTIFGIMRMQYEAKLSQALSTLRAATLALFPESEMRVESALATFAPGVLPEMAQSGELALQIKRHIRAYAHMRSRRDALNRVTVFGTPPSGDPLELTDDEGTPGAPVTPPNNLRRHRVRADPPDYEPVYV